MAETKKEMALRLIGACCGEENQELYEAEGGRLEETLMVGSALYACRAWFDAEKPKEFSQEEKAALLNLAYQVSYGPHPGNENMTSFSEKRELWREPKGFKDVQDALYAGDASTAMDVFDRKWGVHFLYDLEDVDLYRSTDAMTFSNDPMLLYEKTMEGFRSGFLDLHGERIDCAYHAALADLASECAVEILRGEASREDFIKVFHPGTDPRNYDFRSYDGSAHDQVQEMLVKGEDFFALPDSTGAQTLRDSVIAYRAAERASSMRMDKKDPLRFEKFWRAMEECGAGLSYQDADQVALGLAYDRERAAKSIPKGMSVSEQRKVRDALRNAEAAFLDEYGDDKMKRESGIYETHPLETGTPEAAKALAAAEGIERDGAEDDGPEY